MSALPDAATLMHMHDVSGVRALHQVTPQALAQHRCPAGSMGPRVEAACTFVWVTGQRAAIGSLEQIAAMLAGHAGTQVSTDAG
jgi:carbamate kinase